MLDDVLDHHPFLIEILNTLTVIWDGGIIGPSMRTIKKQGLSLPEPLNDQRLDDWNIYIYIYNISNISNISNNSNIIPSLGFGISSGASGSSSMAGGNLARRACTSGRGTWWMEMEYPRCTYMHIYIYIHTGWWFQPL